MKKLLNRARIFGASIRWLFSAPRITALKPGWVITCIRRGDLGWPLRVARWVRGCRVLDVGCGRNLQAIGFLAAGARSYTGLDPRLELDSTVLKDSRSRWSRRTDSNLSPRAIMHGRPQVKFARASLSDFAKSAPEEFDALVMHNVTEHLSDIEAEFAHFSTLLRPGGVIVFRHPNYYAWHGHHCRPRTVAEIDSREEDQAAVLDWAHVALAPERSSVHAWIQKTQNRIRLDELRALVARHFTIEVWEEVESTREQGIERLTPEVLARYPEFPRRELATKAVFVVGRKRA